MLTITVYGSLVRSRLRALWRGWREGLVSQEWSWMLCPSVLTGEFSDVLCSSCTLTESRGTGLNNRRLIRAKPLCLLAFCLFLFSSDFRVRDVEGSFIRVRDSILPPQSPTYSIKPR